MFYFDLLISRRELSRKIVSTERSIQDFSHRYCKTYCYYTMIVLNRGKYLHPALRTCIPLLSSPCGMVHLHALFKRHSWCYICYNKRILQHQPRSSSIPFRKAITIHALSKGHHRTTASIKAIDLACDLACENTTTTTNQNTLEYITIANGYRRSNASIQILHNPSFSARACVRNNYHHHKSQ